MQLVFTHKGNVTISNNARTVKSVLLEVLPTDKLSGRHQNIMISECQSNHCLVRKIKEKKYYAFWPQLNEKLRVIPGCPGLSCASGARGVGEGADRGVAAPENASGCIAEGAG